MGKIRSLGPGKVKVGGYIGVDLAERDFAVHRRNPIQNDEVDD